jgi:hypothetical protein
MNVTVSMPKASAIPALQRIERSWLPPSRTCSAIPRAKLQLNTLDIRLKTDGKP